MERVLTYADRSAAFYIGGVKACPGDVFAWDYPPPIGKEKYNLCLSYDYDFVFLNTPKDKQYRSDFKLATSDIRFLKPTEKRFSAISCANVQTVGTSDRLQSLKPRLVGNIASDVITKVLEHICNLRTTSTEDAERLADVITTLESILMFDEDYFTR